MSSGFIRVPTKKLKIVHLLTANYDPDAREYNTVVGQVRRARLIGTVIEKQLFLRSESGDTDPNSSGNSSSDRMVLTLDDGTGLIRVTNWNATEETYGEISVGQDVEVFGMVRNYKERPYIIPDIVNIIEDPNYESLRDLEIMKLLNQGKGSSSNSSQKAPRIPQSPVSPGLGKSEMGKGSANTKRIDQKEQEPETGGIDDFKLRDKIYEIILSHDTGNGVSFEEIQEDSQLDTVILKRVLGALEKETAIGETHPGIYQPL